MKVLKKISILLIIVVVFLTFLELIPVAPKYKGENTWIRNENKRPLIVPHGGAKLLYPENTIYSFEKMNEAGYDVFEVDLALTADDVLISHHDIDIKRTTNEDLIIREHNYDKLITYNYAVNFINLDGQKPYEAITDETISNKMVPAKLEYLFTQYPDKRYILELKDTIDNSGQETFKHAVNELVTLIDKYNMNDQVIVSSYDDEVTKLFQQKSNGNIMTSTSSSETMKFIILNLFNIDFFYSPKDGALLLPYKDDLTEDEEKVITKLPGFLERKIVSYNEEEDAYYTEIAKKRIIDEAHRHNMAIMYWTVNDKEEMRQLVEMGVDGIITDRPDILKELLEEMGY